MKRNKAPKIKTLNFKKANWEALNNELCNIHWNSILDCMEPELAWLAFKHTFFSIVDEQFSGPSNYNTQINFSNDQIFDIDFNRNRVHKHLSNINFNKASGPDGIHGKIYKIVRKALHILFHSF